MSENDVVPVDGGERLVDGALALRPDCLRLLTDHDLDEKIAIVGSPPWRLECHQYSYMELPPLLKMLTAERRNEAGDLNAHLA